MVRGKRANCNGQTRAFIYDIANTTLVDGATELHPKDRLAWDPDGKCWLRYGFLYGDSYEKTVLLKLPYPEPSTENYKVIPTSDERFVLVLKRLESSFAIGPTMW